MASEKCDVAVIGSGPGGCVASALLAQQGYNVVMIERDRFPRFHVGESLLPGSQPVWEKLGLAEKLERSGHTFKYAGEFRIGRQPDKSDIYSTIGHFHNVPRRDFSPRPYAYHVERSVFDKQMQECAVENGVTLWDNTSVLEVLLDGAQRATGLKFRRDGSEGELDADFVIDASGRRCVMARQLGGIKLDPVIKTSAVFGHFRGVQRDPGYAQGFFNGYFIPNGWIWFIPLAGDVMSVGLVQNKPATDSWSNDPEETLLAAINRYRFIQERFKDAVQVGRVRGMTDLAYETETFCGDGWLSISDANFFVDPLYSSGIQIANSTAEMAAETCDAFLKGGRDMAAIHDYRRHILGYRKRVFRAMRSFYRCMRHYKTIAGYVKATGHWFNHFDNWFLRRACCWGTGRFYRHNWTIQLLSLMGNISAWGAPLVGQGGWGRYEQNEFTGPPLEIPKAAELARHDSSQGKNFVPLTDRGGDHPASELAMEAAGT